VKRCLYCFSTFLIIMIFAAGCSSRPRKIGMPNPASVFCLENGGKLEIRTDENGGQVGYCIFEDGSECEEWAFFRGECKPGVSNEDRK